jgi:hypothetical protein
MADLKIIEAALAVVRSPWAIKLTDRTFLQTIGFASTAVIGCIAAWQTKGIPVDDKIHLTIGALIAVGAVIAAWNHSEKSKDSAVMSAAFNSSSTGEEDVTSPPLDLQKLDSLYQQAMDGWNKSLEPDKTLTKVIPQGVDPSDEKEIETTTQASEGKGDISYLHLALQLLELQGKAAPPELLGKLQQAEAG